MANSSKLERFDNTLAELESELENLKGTAIAFKSLKELVSTYGNIGEHQKEIKDILAEIKKVNNDNFEQLRKENKEAYFDFEKTLKIKLDENKSEIKRLIEDERQKIISELDQRTNRILQYQNGIKNTVLILGIIILLIVVASLVVQFMN